MKTLILSTLFFLCASVPAFAQSVPTFREYPSRVEKIKNIKVDLKSHKDARMFRTNLRNAAKGGVNFAGHYVVTTWGCGTNCSQTAVIEARSGKVFFPPMLEGATFGFCDLPDNIDEPLAYKANSRMLILYGMKAGDIDSKNGKCGIYYFEWDGWMFKQLKFVEKKRTDTP